MSTLEARNILSDAIDSVRPFARTHGAPPEALATPTTDDASLWDDACERMLAWRADPSVFDEDDRPTVEILDTAIDFAVDEGTRGGASPSIIVPSGDGRVAFEWHFRRSTMILEFVGCGRAKYTMFADGRVIEQGVLVRNPRSRKLELGG